MPRVRPHIPQVKTDLPCVKPNMAYVRANISHVRLQLPQVRLDIGYIGFHLKSIQPYLCDCLRPPPACWAIREEKYFNSTACLVVYITCAIFNRLIFSARMRINQYIPYILLS